MVYEFWDMRTNNLLDAFDREENALMALLEVTKDHGDRAAEFVMLIEDDPDSDYSRVVGIGSDLIEYARRVP